MKRQFDLEDRLLDLAVAITRVCERLPSSVAGNRVSSQLIRSGTSPVATYAEATGAESRKDFAHKMKMGLKDLRESKVWLRYALRMRLGRTDEIEPLVQECNELIAIFVPSIRTAQQNLSKHGH